MTPAETAVVIALAARMSAACTDEQARLVASTSLDEGAPLMAVAEALIGWLKEHARNVQVVSS